MHIIKLKFTQSWTLPHVPVTNKIQNSSYKYNNNNNNNHIMAGRLCVKIVLSDKSLTCHVS